MKEERYIQCRDPGPFCRPAAFTAAFNRDGWGRLSAGLLPLALPRENLDLYLVWLSATLGTCQGSSPSRLGRATYGSPTSGLGCWSGLSKEKFSLAPAHGDRRRRGRAGRAGQLTMEGGGGGGGGKKTFGLALYLSREREVERERAFPRPRFRDAWRDLDLLSPAYLYFLSFFYSIFSTAV